MPRAGVRAQRGVMLPPREKPGDTLKEMYWREGEYVRNFKFKGLGEGTQLGTGLPSMKSWSPNPQNVCKS